MFSVNELGAYIEEQTGLILTPCDSFSGLKQHQGRSYYNFLVNDRFSESQEVLQLLRLADTSSRVYKIESNGLNRVAIFFH